MGAIFISNFTEAFQQVKLNNKMYDLEDGAPRKIRTSDRSVRSRVLYPAELWVQLILWHYLMFIWLFHHTAKYGAPRKIRTSDRSVRSRVLYPAELWVHSKWRWGRDSNPRYSFWPYTPLAGERLQPLGHLTIRFFRIVPDLLFKKAHRHCVAHILLSRTYKSNNFSQLTFICTIHTQHDQFDVKKSVLSTGKIVFIAT